MGTMAGKLNGVMPAQTPMGWRMVLQSISRAVERIAHHEAGHAAGHFRHLYAPAHFGAGVFDGLAVLARQSGGHVFGVLFEQRLVAIEHLHTVYCRHLAPFQEGRMRGANRTVDIRLIGERHFGNGGAGGWIGDRSERAPVRLLPGAIDIKRNRPDCGISSDHVPPPDTVAQALLPAGSRLDSPPSLPNPPSAGMSTGAAA
jgi:hypothetical protein